MSIPTHPHHLRRGDVGELGEAEAYFKDGEKAGRYVAHRHSQMRCDGAMGRCKLPPSRGLLILIGCKPWDPFIPPLTVFTTLHYCQPHIESEASAMVPADVLSDAIKRQIEDRAKAQWGHELRADFSRARLKWELVTTPEYRAFLERIETRGRETGGAVLSRQGIPLL